MARTKHTLISILIIALQASGCSAVDAPTCADSLTQLKSTVDLARSDARLSDDQRHSLRTQIADTERTCDATKFEPGMRIISALTLLKDDREIARLFEMMRAETPKERDVLLFRASEFFVATGNKLRAKHYVDTLDHEAEDRDLADTAISQYQCRFERCALVNDKLKSLVAKFPTVIGFRVLLGFSLADMRDFEAASREFDNVVQSGEIGAFDSNTALIAIAAYVNSGQREKARVLFERFSQISAPIPGISDQNFANMRAILEDTSGKVFYFSEWPIPAVLPPDPAPPQE